MSYAMRAASQLLEGGPLVWMMPLHLLKSHYDDYNYDVNQLRSR